MTQLWRINLKSAAEPGHNPRKYCLDRQRLGMGWPVAHQGPLDWEAYFELACKRYGRKGRKKFAPVVTLHDKVAPGDLCWTRDLDGNYYLEALRRWVWNSPPELGQDMTSTTTGGMTWTAPRF